MWKLVGGGNVEGNWSSVRTLVIALPFFIFPYLFSFLFIWYHIFSFILAWRPFFYSIFTLFGVRYLPFIVAFFSLYSFHI